MTETNLKIDRGNCRRNCLKLNNTKTMTIPYDWRLVNNRLELLDLPVQIQYYRNYYKVLMHNLMDTSLQKLFVKTTCVKKFRSLKKDR